MSDGNRMFMSLFYLSKINPVQYSQTLAVQPEGADVWCIVCGDTPDETPGHWTSWRDTNPHVESWLCDDCVGTQQAMFGDPSGDQLFYVE